MDKILEQIEDSILYKMTIWGKETEKTLFFTSNPMVGLDEESTWVDLSHCDENGKIIGKITLSYNIPYTIEEFKKIKNPTINEFLFEEKYMGLSEEDYIQMCIEYNMKQKPITGEVK